MLFSTLLRESGIDPKTVLVMRHQPTEPKLRRELRRLALEDEQTLIDYQSSHGLNTERAIVNADYIASFLADGSGRALFVGLFQIVGQEVAPWHRWLENPRLRELVALGSDSASGRGEVIWFSQRRTDFYPQWKGRLVVAWPTPERAWYRWAHRNEFEVLAIHDEQTLVSRLADWDELVFDWQDLANLPRRHRELLESWRGIYLIRDRLDGKGYVGSAYGADNLLGRWLNYSRTGHGDNKLLRGRDPAGFRFSILERLAETSEPLIVIERERRWKLRLGTAFPEGLNLN